MSNVKELEEDRHKRNLTETRNAVDSLVGTVLRKIGSRDLRAMHRDLKSLKALIIKNERRVFELLSCNPDLNIIVDVFIKCDGLVIVSKGPISTSEICLPISLVEGMIDVLHS